MKIHYYPLFLSTFASGHFSAKRHVMGRNSDGVMQPKKISSDQSKPTRQVHTMSYSAGILPISRFNGELLVLLGRDRADGQWSDFGGRSEAEDRGDPKRTAAREFFEESMGVVLSIEAVGARLDCSKCHTKIESRTMGGQSYSMYVVGVPFFHTYGSQFLKVARFARYMEAKRRFLEKSEISWFNMNDLIAAARGVCRAKHAPTPLRDVFAASVRLGAESLRCAWNLELYPVRTYDGRTKGPNASVSATPIPISPTLGAGRGGCDGTDSLSVSL